MSMRTISIALLFAMASASVLAKGGHHSVAIGPGTGSTSSSHHVNGYVKKDGTYIAPHQQSNADKDFNNNWSTKGNENPTTGKDGTRVTEPGKN
ncbi:MAG: hypothetical protein QM749_19745 [Aquabacterium sp.]